jgi:lysophospholipase L1-like esterase
MKNHLLVKAVVFIFIGCALMVFGVSCSTLSDSIFSKDCNYGRDAYYFDQVKQFHELESIGRPVIMVGDSLTYGGSWGQWFPSENMLNFGIPGDDTYGVFMRIPQIVEKDPRKIFILIGVNDIRKACTDEQIGENYTIMINKLKRELPNAKVYLQTMLPTDGKVRDNADIQRLNTVFRIKAKSFNVPIIDMFPFFVGVDGNVKPEYVKDGIHLTPAGYAIWKDKITPFIKE